MDWQFLNFYFLILIFIMDILGVGSRVNHVSYGKGVVIHVHKRVYEYLFIEGGIKTVSKDHALELIERIEPEYNVSFSEAEDALIKILREWSDVSEVVSLGDKWKDGTMILKPGDSSLKEKEVPVDIFLQQDRDAA
jgi:hypothetical protein